MSPITLAIDIGGSGIKTMLLDKAGQPLSPRRRQSTPHPPTPPHLLQTIRQLSESHQQEDGIQYDRISVGFPGVVRNGCTRGAINLDPSWDGYPLQAVLQDLLSAPVRIANDADVQGYGAVQGKGVELVITLGTGFGSALFLNGQLIPNLELGQHPWRASHTYEQQLGQNALTRIGIKTWNQRLKKAIASLELLFNYDQLYLGGGNAKKITIPLPANAQTISNDKGLLGGIRLWQDQTGAQNKTEMPQTPAVPAETPTPPNAS